MQVCGYRISDQRKPAICLQPNKTFQTSNAAVYYTEATTLSGSSTGSVGGNVWNKLSWNQRRLIGLIALYGVQTNWDNSVGNAGLNTGYNLQNPTNPNQCLFAAQQIMTWEVVTGNRSATYPYSCTNSKLINAFGGDVPAQYAWLENQIRAHDNATTTIPSPERSTYPSGLVICQLSDRYSAPGGGIRNTGSSHRRPVRSENLQHSNWCLRKSAVHLQGV